MKKKPEFHISSKHILAVLTIFCIFLIGVSTVKNEAFDPLRGAVGYVLVPIQKSVNQLGSTVYDGLADILKLKNALKENASLKEQVEALTEENNRLKQDQYELKRLRSLYELDQTYLDYEKIGARVIAKDSGNWFHVFRIDKGTNDGVQVNANVLAEGGLVGIVTDVGPNYATVRSIIDDANNVSAMSLSSSADCIVSGDLKLYKEGKIRLSYMDKDDAIYDSDKIVTSQISDTYLPGILIGYATGITVDSNNLTKSGYLIPYVDFDSLREVLVITQLKDTKTSEEE